MGFVGKDGWKSIETIGSAPIWSVSAAGGKL